MWAGRCLHLARLGFLFLVCSATSSAGTLLQQRVAYLRSKSTHDFSILIHYVARDGYYPIMMMVLGPSQTYFEGALLEAAFIHLFGLLNCFSFARIASINHSRERRNDSNNEGRRPLEASDHSAAERAYSDGAWWRPWLVISAAFSSVRGTPCSWTMCIPHLVVVVLGMRGVLGRLL